MVDPEKLARETEKADQASREIAASDSKGVVWLPNNTKVKAKPFLEMRTKMNRRQNEFFTDPEKIKSLLKDPEPGYHYHWARHPQYEPMTGIRVAQGLYSYVNPKELKSETMPMFANHKGTSGTMVAFGTLVLVKESDEAFRETHLAPQVDAIVQLARIEQEFMGDIEETSKGRAEGTVTREEETEEIHPQR